MWRALVPLALVLAACPERFPERHPDRVDAAENDDRPDAARVDARIADAPPPDAHSIDAHSIDAHSIDAHPLDAPVVVDAHPIDAQVQPDAPVPIFDAATPDARAAKLDARISIDAAVIDAAPPADAWPLPTVTTRLPTGFFRAILDSANDRVFLSYPDENTVRRLDLRTGVIDAVTTPHPPEFMVYDASLDALYVTLRYYPHDPYWIIGYFGADQIGGAAKLSASPLSVVATLESDRDPWEIVETKPDLIVASGGSGQWTNLASYDFGTGKSIVDNDTQIFNLSTLALPPTADRIYSVEPDTTPSYVYRWDLTRGLPTYDDYGNSTDSGQACWPARLNRAGTRIFDGCGRAFDVTAAAATDRTYAGDLGQIWYDAAFSPGDARLFVLPKTDWFTASASTIAVFDPTTLASLGTVAVDPPVNRIVAGPWYLLLISDDGTATQVRVVPYTALP